MRKATFRFEKDISALSNVASKAVCQSQYTMWYLRFDKDHVPVRR